MHKSLGSTVRRPYLIHRVKTINKTERPDSLLIIDACSIIISRYLIAAFNICRSASYRILGSLAIAAARSPLVHAAQQLPLFLPIRFAQDRNVVFVMVNYAG